MSALTQPVLVTPADAHNVRLVLNLHPPDWENPTPAPRYNLVVIGAVKGSTHSFGYFW